MRSVLFDVDGVLVHSMFHPDPSRIRDWGKHLEADFGIPRETFNQFFHQGYGEVARGEKSIITALDAFLPTIGSEANALDVLSYWLENDTPVNRPLLDGIKRLNKSGKAKVYLATNQEHQRAYHLWTELRLGHIFEDMFYSARLGVGKPAPEYFVEVEKRLGPQSEAPLFFDDSQKNVDAGNAHGWESALFLTEDDFFDHPWIREVLK